MFLSKKGIIVIAVAIYYGVEYYIEYTKVPIPSFVNYLQINPIFYKLNQLLERRLYRFSNFLARNFKLGTTYGNMRGLLEIVMQTKGEKDIDASIKRHRTTINKVNATIYSSIHSEEKFRPVIIYYHGGGYFLNMDYSFYLSELARHLEFVVISIDYRLAPEFPLESVNDCYAVTDYVLKNPAEFKGIEDQIILAGDSAGGNAVAVITQRLLKENKKQPKLQVLIYPWLQLSYSPRLPSYQAHTSEIISPFSKQMIYWYLGFENITENEFFNILDSKEHFALLDSESRNKIDSYLDLSLIPEKYKTGRKYYEEYSKNIDYPTKLPDNHLLIRDEKLAEKFRKLFSPEISPGLADDLKGLPDAYIIVGETDVLKDENLIYAERLKRAGVNTKIAFYEHSYHGVSQMLHLRTAQDMLADLVTHIKQNF